MSWLLSEIMASLEQEPFVYEKDLYTLTGTPVPKEPVPSTPPEIQRDLYTINGTLITQPLRARL
jgi:hypothetical protein